MDRIRTVKSGDFTTIDNTISRDKRASLRARGLMLTIMSLPESWDFTVNGLVAILREKRGVVYRVIDELIRLGYCERRENPKNKGRFAGSVYTFYESLSHRVPSTGYGQPDSVSGTQSNTHIKGEIPHDPHTQSYVRVGDTYVGTGDDFFANLKDDEVGTPQLLIDVEPKERHKTVPIPDSAYHHMYRICYLAETVEEAKTLNSRQRGRVASVLGQLRNADADFNRLTQFETWWKGTWLSKNRDTGSYMPPRPEQVSEYWWTAIKAQEPKGPETNGKQPEQPQGPSLAEIEKAMQARRTHD